MKFRSPTIIFDDGRKVYFRQHGARVTIWTANGHLAVKRERFIEHKNK